MRTASLTTTCFALLSVLAVASAQSPMGLSTGAKSSTSFPGTRIKRYDIKDAPTAEVLSVHAELLEKLETDKEGILQHLANLEGDLDRERAARAELEKQIQALHAAIHDLRPASGGGPR